MILYLTAHLFFVPKSAKKDAMKVCVGDQFKSAHAMLTQH